jgi:hypothetical protein
MKILTVSILSAAAVFAQAHPGVRRVQCNDAGSTDSYACSPSPSVASYTDGLEVRLTVNTANTGAATLAVSGLAAKNIVKLAGGVSTTLADNDLVPKGTYTLVYNSADDNFKVTSMVGTAGSGSSAISSAAADVRPLGWPTAVGTGTLGTANRVFLLPFTIQHAITINRVNLEVTTQYSSGGNAVLGFYNSSGDRIHHTAVTTAFESAGAKSVTLGSAVDLTPGSYFFAIATDSTALAFRIYAGTSTLVPIWNADSVSGSSYGYCANTATGGSSLPATCGTITEGNYNTPIVFLKP